MENSLSGKVALVTGASSGIGAAIARALHKSGCKLALAARSGERLAAMAAELGPDALAVPTDLTDGAQIVRMTQATLERFGRLDILVANAGIYIPGEVVHGNPDDWSRLLTINVDAVFRCVHAALPAMREQRSGDILVTSSISGHIDIVWEPIYSASKHAVQSFVHTLRRQVAADGIRVGSLAPGRTANALWGVTDTGEIDRQVAEKMSLRSEDVAAAAVFMLAQPPHVTIRDLVMLPQSQDL